MSGYAEFNDATAIIRGHMEAGDGDFAGSFSASNVDAVNDINIKGNSVSGYYVFGVSGQTDITFTVPAQIDNYQQKTYLTLSMLNPVEDRERNRVIIYRDDVKIVDRYITRRIGILLSAWEVYKLVLPVFCYFVDNIDTRISHTYRYVVESIYSEVYFLGNVVVEFRKR